MQKDFFPMTSLIRCIILSSASMLLFSVQFIMPWGMGLAISVFAPTPIALLGVREGKAWMVLAIFSVTVALGIALTPGHALFFLLLYGLLCFGLTLPLGKLENGSESLLFCIIVSIVSKLLFVLAMVALGEGNPFAVDPDAIRNMLLGGQGDAELSESQRQALELAPYIVPSLIVMFSVFDSFANYKLCEVIQRERDVTFAPLPPFGEWRFPTSLLYVLVFAFALPFIVDRNAWQLWVMLEHNLKLIVNLFFFLQGLALVWWWLSKYALRAFPLPLRIMLVGILAIFSTFIVALGIGDMCFDFRARTIGRA